MRLNATNSCSAVLLAVLVCLPSVLTAGDVEDEYLQRFKALDVKDVSGHFELAKWCREQENWQLVAQQCRHVLRLEPNHQQARLLLEVAQRRLGGDPRSPSRGPGSGGPLRPLTDAEVQRIRRMELDPDQDERIILRIDRKTLRAFYEVAHKEGYVDCDRRTFFRLPRLEQAWLILRHAPDRFGNAVTIKSDPQRMRTFVREVQPIVLRGCAAADCHGGAAAAGDFQLLGGRSLGPNESYANFLRMHEHQVGTERVINRDQPGQSLLLTYALPPHQVAEQTRRHPTEIMPIFQSSTDQDYQTVLDWLTSLSITRPDYGIKLKAGGQP